MVISGNLDERYKEKAYYGLLTSYMSIMKAKEVDLESNAPFPIFDSDIGTIIHVAPKEEIEAVLPTISDVRYIGYINCDEGIRTKNYVPYVGIPVSNNYMQNIPVEKEMWKVKYPHITLSRTMSADQLKIIGKTIRFKLAYNYMGTNMAMIH